MVVRSWLLGLTLLLRCEFAAAADARGFDVSALDAPVREGPFSIARVAEARPPGQMDMGLRVGLFLEPLNLRVPSPAPFGYEAPVVQGVVLTELTLAVALPRGFDLGLALGAHTYQWGAGTDATEGTVSSGLPSFGASDPRFEGGVSVSLGPVTLRPFLGFTLPLGRVDAFSGERFARVEAGASLCDALDKVVYGVEASFLYRPPQEFSGSVWGPQLRFVGSLLYRPLSWLLFGPELLVAPVLSGQADPDGGGTFALVPGEALGTVKFVTDTVGVGVFAGSGLPLTRTAPEGGSLARAATSPTFRAGVDLRFSR